MDEVDETPGAGRGQVGVLAGGEGQAVPVAFALDQNVPNPFNPRTTISFALPEPRPVRLKIFDLTGDLVTVLVDGELPAGFHRVDWHGQDARGVAMASGVYFYQLDAGPQCQTRRMLLVR